LILEDGDSLATLDKQMATNAERLGIPVLTFS
jgi:rRNA-processing protein FCF1